MPDVHGRLRVESIQLEHGPGLWSQGLLIVALKNLTCCVYNLAGNGACTKRIQNRISGGFASPGSVKIKRVNLPFRVPFSNVV